MGDPQNPAGLHGEEQLKGVGAEIEDGSFAQQLNLQRGDVVLAVNDQKITATRDLAMVAAGRAYYWKITLARGGQVFTSVVGGQ